MCKAHKTLAIVQCPKCGYQFTPLKSSLPKVHCPSCGSSFQAIKIDSQPDQPDQPEASATVEGAILEMRSFTRDVLSGTPVATVNQVNRWADALEAAENDADHLRECLMKTEERLAEYAPPFTDQLPKPSATVEMREYARISITDTNRQLFTCWANELEAAEQRIAELEEERDKWRGAFGNAEASCLELAKRASDLRRQLKPPEPAAGEVDWEAIAQAGRKAYGGEEEFAVWDDTIHIFRERWTRCAKAVIAAYEAQKPRDKVAAVVKCSGLHLHGFESDVDAEAFWDNQAENGAYEKQGAKKWTYHPTTKSEEA